MRTAIFTIVLVLGMVFASVGVPRLIGFNCERTLFGWSLAQEESDFPGRCRRIEKLPLIG